jgi:hypothetical protein
MNEEYGMVYEMNLSLGNFQRYLSLPPADGVQTNNLWGA